MGIILKSFSRSFFSILVVFALLIVPPHPSTFKNFANSSIQTNWQISNASESYDAISCPNYVECIVGGSTGQGIGTVSTYIYSSLNNYTPNSSFGNINEMSCPSTTTCFGSVEMPSTATSELIASSNGGATFTSLNSPQNIRLYTAIACTTQSTCIFLGSNIYANPVVYLTTNGGASFTPISIPSQILEVTGATCIADSFECAFIGLDSSSIPYVLTTSNLGGTITINTVNLGSIAGISCVSLTQCYLIGMTYQNAAYLGFSSNFFVTSSQLQLQSSLQTLNAISCAPDSASFICAIAGQDSNESAVIEGSSSSTVFSPIPIDTPLLKVGDISCAPNAPTTDCTFIGSSTSSNAEIGSIDSVSATISNQSTGYKAISSISCPDQSFCLGISKSSQGAVMQTTDFGGSWQMSLNPTSPSTFQSVSCFSNNFCGTVGTTNASIPFFYYLSASKWYSGNLPATSFAPNSVSCPSSQECLVSSTGSNGMPQLLETTNEGASFSSIALPSDVLSIFGISCSTQTFCMIVGRDTSGGATVLSFNGTSVAELTPPSTVANINSLSCTSVSSCIFAGDDYFGNPAIFYTSNGTTFASSTISAPNDVIESISCDPSLTICTADGIAPSSNDAVLFESGDGGSTWSNGTIPNGTYPLSTVTCMAASECIAAGGLDGGITLVLPASPNISSITPSSGPDSGGTEVTITGSNFNQATSVNFGSNAATSFQVINDDTIEASTPPGNSSVTVSVSNPIGTSTSASSFQYNSYSYTPINPSRICDTRPANGTSIVSNECDTGSNSTLKSGTILNVSIPTSLVASNATSVVLNVTATDTSSNGGFLTIWPTGVPMPSTSSLNFNANDTVANLVELGLGTNQSISIYNALGNTDVLVDLEGYSSPTIGSQFISISPSRICDTRQPVGAILANQCDSLPNSTLTAGSTINVTATGVPTGATAVVINVTATDTSSNGGYLTIWPTGSSRPNASNLNFNAGLTIANRVIVPIDSSDQFSIYNAVGSTDVIVDLNGYFIDSSGTTFIPVTPVRICDTRQVNGFSILANQCNVTNSSLVQQSTISVNVNVQNVIPPSATAIVLNVTVADTSANGGYLTIYPSATGTPPTISDLNWYQGEVVANMSIVKIGTGFSIDIYNGIGSTDVMVDVMGYYN